MFQVFKRKAYRPNKSWPDGFEPAGDCRKTPVCRVETREEARAICQKSNSERPPTGTKAYYNFVWCEFESD